MKHLYKIEVEHSGPKDSCLAISGYIITDSEEKVYNYMANVDAVNQLGIYTSWDYKFDEGADDNEIYEYEIIDPETGKEVLIEENWKERMIRLKGELNDEERSYEDAYYGISFYGWVDNGELTEEEVEVLIKFLGKDVILIK